MFMLTISINLDLGSIIPILCTEMCPTLKLFILKSNICIVDIIMNIENMKIDHSSDAEHFNPSQTPPTSFQPVRIDKCNCVNDQAASGSNT